MAEVKYENRLQKKYNEEIVPALVKEFGYTSVMQAPKIEKIVLNCGVGEATNAENELFGNERMLDVLNSQPARKPHALLETMKREIDVFVGEAPQFDDITMMCVICFRADPQTYRGVVHE